MTFTPKFVDLVRNTSTATGTGALALGAAASGYSGFTEALSIGDQFYYCVQGVDRPTEREVGRGTLLAGGKIGREPIGGALTNFSSGTKTVALVAAAEWFARVDGAAEAASAGVANRAALAATPGARGGVMLCEAGREGLFVWDGSDLSAKVAADPRQAVHVAPASDPDGSSGAWVRKFSGLVNVRWFGAVGDDVADDGPAFRAAVDYCNSQKVTAAYGYGTGGSVGLFIPAGKYFLGTSTIELRHSLRVLGEFVGNAATGGSMLRWAANTTGIRVQGYGTSGDTGFGNAALNGGRVHIEGLFLRGGFNGVDEGDYHGINVRGSATLKDLFVSNFAGDGVHSFTDAASLAGNANGSTVENVYVEQCRHGFYLGGLDSNAWQFMGASAVLNRGTGFLDSAALGSFYFGCHVASNGDGGAAFPSRCSHGGNRYFVLRGQEAWCKANAPSGTTANNQGWAFSAVGGVDVSWPAWTSGAAYRVGAGYCADNVNNGAIFICYSEGDALCHQMAGTALILGAQHNVVDLSGNPWGGQFYGDGSATVFPKLVRSGGFESTGATNSISALDPALNLNTTGSVAAINFQANGAEIGRMLMNSSYGFIFDAIAGKAFYINNANSTVLAVDANGMNLSAGKALSVNGQQVVGARQAAIADDASGSANQGKVNAILAALRTHGLIA